MDKKETEEKKEIKEVESIMKEIDEHRDEVGGIKLGIEQQGALVEGNEKSTSLRIAANARRDNSFGELQNKILKLIIDDKKRKESKKELTQIYNLGKAHGRSGREVEQIGAITRQAEETKSILENEKLVHLKEISELRSKLKIGVRK